MPGATFDERIAGEQVKMLLRSLNAALAAPAQMAERLDAIVGGVSQAIDCDHVFLSVYNRARRRFKAIAWRSSLKPDELPLEAKFMGDKYAGRETVLINDLSQYNHRLRPVAARLRLGSMIGVPVLTGDAVTGALEVYSHKIGNYTEVDAGILTVFAGIAATVLERMAQADEIRYTAAENTLLKLLLHSERMSTFNLLYSLGELFKTTLAVDGIIVFGAETGESYSRICEVMQHNFPRHAIERFKAAFTAEFALKLTQLPDTAAERYVIVQSPGSIGVDGARAMYLVPIVWRQTLYGLLVFYRKQTGSETDLPQMEHFVKQITAHIGFALDRKASLTHMQRISLTDTLTKLANRRLFDFVLEREFKRVKRTGKPLSLLMIDIDYFKTVNDRYGHAAGDCVLEQIGELLVKCFRVTDIAARYGGEEFAVILPETDRHEAMMVAERFRTWVAEQEFICGDQIIRLTASIGIAAYDGLAANSITTPEILVLSADQALYRAKQLGRNLTIVWSGDAIT